MNVETYCATVCKAKCCHARHMPEEGVVRCPRLKGNNTCGVYERRYQEGMPDVVMVGHFRSRAIKDLYGKLTMRPFYCGYVRKLYAVGAIPPSVAEQCCVIHPEILENFKEKKEDGNL